MLKPVYFFVPLQDFNGNVNTNKPAILETIVTGDQFARENEDRLLPEQKEELQRKTDELRTYFDTVENKAAKIGTDTKANIDKLEWEITEEGCYYTLKIPPFLLLAEKQELLTLLMQLCI